ncbi:MAG: DUF1294 domain-containing protein [Clostridia bacterium]|nr:DUF1294 domain-containing protein [Clostridia bacterium]MBQ6004365.1 DUF1294 domain-containing protein [Clostridia bacterium]MBR6136501.1 DUF1294 domain-containing protein [Clostridia bacterium]
MKTLLENERLLLFLILVFLNLAVFIVYGADKLKAERNKWRISERTLLLLAFFAPFGAIAGMLIFRHKTRKKLFTVLVPLFLAVHLFVIIMVLKNVLH